MSKLYCEKHSIKLMTAAGFISLYRPPSQRSKLGAYKSLVALCAGIPRAEIQKLIDYPVENNKIIIPDDIFISKFFKEYSRRTGVNYGMIDNSELTISGSGVCE